MNDTALLVDLLIGEQQAMAPILEDEHTRVYRPLTCGGYVVNDIDSLGKIGIGIIVALGIEIVIDAVALAIEVLTTVKCHVLQEVGQTVLVVFFLHSTHALGDVEVGTLLGIVVVADVVGQPAIQLTYSHGLVDGQFHLLGHHHVGAE